MHSMCSYLNLVFSGKSTTSTIYRFAITPQTTGKKKHFWVNVQNEQERM